MDVALKPHPAGRLTFWFLFFAGMLCGSPGWGQGLAGPGNASPGAPSVPDADFTGFEDGLVPVLVGTFDGTPPTATLALTDDPAHVKEGAFALEYSYVRQGSSLDAVFQQSLLTDLVGLRMWLQSEQDAVWVVGHADRDGAVFLAQVVLPAGQWVHLDLAPGDFAIDPNSPVQKPAMQPKRNGANWVGFDLDSVIGPAGPNRIWIDAIEVERPPLRYEKGPLVVSATAIRQVQESTFIDGDLIVAAGGFHSSASRLVVNGDIIVLGYGSLASAVFTRGTLRMNAHYRYQRKVQAEENGLVRFQDLLFLPGSNTSLNVGSQGVCEILDTDFAQGSFTAGVGPGGRITIRGSSNPGEFLPGEGSHFEASDVNQLLLWLVAEPGTQAQVVLPPASVGDWTLDPSWNRDLTLHAIGALDTGLIIEDNSTLDVLGGTARAVGVLFSQFDADLDGFQNGDHITDRVFSWPGRNVHFQDVTVQTWNFYSAGLANVVVRNSLFGEALSFGGGGSLQILDSTCDGSGGYFGARNDGQVDAANSQILSEIVCDGTSVMRLKNSVVNGAVTAAGNALICLFSTPVFGPLFEIDNGRILVK